MKHATLWKVLWFATFVTLIAIFGFMIGVADEVNNGRPGSHRSQETYEEFCEKYGKKSFWERAACDPVAEFTGILTVATGILAGLSCLSFIYVIEADKTAKRASDIAGEMAQNATTQARHMRELADATAKAAIAADLSTKAAIALQMPLLRAGLTEPVLLQDERADKERLGGQINGGGAWKTRRAAIIDIRIRNDGRTAAAPLRIRAGWCVADRLVGEPHYTTEGVSSAQSLLREDKEVITRIALVVEITAEQLSSVQPGGGCWVWVYASVEYVDFLDRTHEARFCWRWEAQTSMGNHRWNSPADVPPAYKLKT